MESISLTFLPTLLFCFVSVAVVTASGMDLRDEPIIRTSSVRLNDKGRHLPIQSDFNNPNERIFRRPEVSNKRPFSGNSKSRWNSNRNPDPSFRNSPPRKSPNSKSKPSTANFDQVVEDLFPGLFTTTRRPPISTKKAKQPVNEIHVQINDVADLSNLLGYDDIVFEIDPPLRSPPKNNVKGGNKAAKPFWGPPLVAPTTTRPPFFNRALTTTRSPIYDRPFEVPKTTPSLKIEDFSLYYTSTVRNIWDLTTSGPKIPEVKSNEQNKRPTETFWGPIHLRPTTGKDQKNDPFSLEFWDNPTEPTIYSYSPITTTEHYSRQPPGNINDAPGLSGKETPTSSSPPSLLSKEILIEPPPYSPGGLIPYPIPAPPQPPPQAKDYHAPYHEPPRPHYTPSFAKVDFSPLFLALIPLALVLGAAASFALASAVSSSTAVASAQQQQQQQEASNSNSNNNNNNANTILSLLAALRGNDYNDYINPYFLIVNGTSVLTGDNVIGRRRKLRRLNLT